MPKENKNNIFKIIIIFILVFIVVPFGILTLIYFTNSNFNSWMNTNLRTMPGLIGQHFRKFPTEEERVEKEIYLASYYANIESERAADKIYIIKKSDEELYNNIIRRMNSISTSKTEEVIKKIRNLDLRKDLLFSIYDEIQNEEEVLLQNEVKRLEGLKTYFAIKEIEISIDSNENLNNIVNVLPLMKEDKLIEILYYLDEEARNKLLNKFNTVDRKKFVTELEKKERKINDLTKLAEIYEVKAIDKAIDDIGNNDNYTMSELANIYMNLSIKRTSEILFKNNDKEFQDDLFEAISREEQLLDVPESSIVNISKTINFLSDYERKIEELVLLYEKMNSDEIAKIIDNMTKNDSQLTSFEIEPNSYYNISDSDIVIDILSRLRKNKLSDIIIKLDEKKATEITRRLALY